MKSSACLAKRSACNDTLSASSSCTRHNKAKSSRSSSLLMRSVNTICSRRYLNSAVRFSSSLCALLVVTTLLTSAPLRGRSVNILLRNRVTSSLNSDTKC
uniref:Uncharacterized protein n=1 Tax=Glossina palpalis gambiensis TaxID=67801 RepID=A0A1B0BXL3_9MUSC